MTKMRSYHHRPHYKPHIQQRQLRISNLDQQTAKSCLHPLHILVSLKTVASMSTRRKNIPNPKLKPQFLGNATSTHHICSNSISEQNQRFRSVALAQSIQTVASKGRICLWIGLWNKSMTLIMRGRETRDVINRRVGGKAKQKLETRVEG